MLDQRQAFQVGDLFHQVVDSSGWESPAEYNRPDIRERKVRFVIRDLGLVQPGSSKLRPATN